MEKEDKKITIGLFSESWYPMSDGVITVVDNYAKRLSKVANVIVFAPRYLTKKYDDSVFPYKVVRCASVKLPLLDYSMPIPRLDPFFMWKMRKYKLDIVHIHGPFTIGRFGYKYALKHNIPCIATMHSQFQQDFKKAVKSNRLANKLNHQICIKLFDKCDECWAVNEEVARIYYEDYHCKKLPRVMNNATEMVPIKDMNKAKNRINKLHHIRGNEIVFLFVGRINSLKNIYFTADALAIFKDKYHLPFKMLYVGSGRDSERLQNHIDELGLTKEVTLVGRVMDRELLASYFARADLFLFPSVYDASSIVQIEASSQKTPALFLKGTATACTVTDNVNGFLSDYDPESYADRMYEIVSNKKFLKEVSENAHRDLYKTWEEAVDEAYDLYLKAIEEKKEGN